MAALETPWTASHPHHHHHHPHHHRRHSRQMSTDVAAAVPIGSQNDAYPPTFAAFSPASASPASRSSFQVHQKSPLLVATPPQVTRALSRAYPWIRHADYAFGLLTWTSRDPWESFLMVGCFWIAALYGDVMIRWGGNVVAVALLIVGMMGRRYMRRPVATATTLDDILAALNSLNHRVETFFVPLTTLLNLLSSQKDATTTTTRPALTVLFVRMLMLTPVWWLLAIYPLQFVTPKRIVVAVGTIVLSWHSRPAKVARTIAWRSATVRGVAEQATGLVLTPAAPPPPLPPREKVGEEDARAGVAGMGVRRMNSTAASPGVRFTFSIFENQRRWLGVGWTSTMFVYERAPWTDENLVPCPPPNEFVLPHTTPDSGAHWRWVEGEDWEVEGGEGGEGRGGTKQELKDRLGGPGDASEGWWYYDNKWRDGKWGVDGWGKYTRRRKWVRRAELVEDDEVEGEGVAGGASGAGGEGGEGEHEKAPPPQYEEAITHHNGKGKGKEVQTNDTTTTAHTPRVPPPLPPRRPPQKRVSVDKGRRVGSVETLGASSGDLTGDDEEDEVDDETALLTVSIVDADASEGEGKEGKGGTASPPPLPKRR